jgi:tRNA A37 threonylcarbamoyladenosine biosynthesis protein TsaE
MTAMKMNVNGDKIHEQQTYQKVVVIGASCSGKTTFSRSLAMALGTEHIELNLQTLSHHFPNMHLNHVY